MMLTLIFKGRKPRQLRALGTKVTTTRGCSTQRTKMAKMADLLRIHSSGAAVSMLRKTQPSIIE